MTDEAPTDGRESMSLSWAAARLGVADLGEAKRLYQEYGCVVAGPGPGLWLNRVYSTTPAADPEDRARKRAEQLAARARSEVQALSRAFSDAAEALRLWAREIEANNETGAV